MSSRSGGNSEAKGEHPSSSQATPSPLSRRTPGMVSPKPKKLSNALSLLSVPGIGPKNESMFKAKGIHNIEDLKLIHFNMHKADSDMTRGFVEGNIGSGKSTFLRILETNAVHETLQGIIYSGKSTFLKILEHNAVHETLQSLLREPLTKRREAMYASFQEREGEFLFATEKTSKDVEELARFLDDAVEHSTEGLIVKTLCDTYEPAKRSSHWLKLKKDYMDGVGDTFDVVPIGGFHGKGKRTGLFGAYLLAVYDPETEAYQTIQLISYPPLPYHLPGLFGAYLLAVYDPETEAYQTIQLISYPPLPYHLPGLFGAYLLAVYDPETETYQTLAKLGTGFTEEVLQQLTDTMKPHTIKEPRRYYTYGETLEPDVWFDAAVVWEVKAADLSISPVHKAGLGILDPMPILGILDPSKGISIRFPRLIRVRDDKGPEDATTAQQVAEMYSMQASVKQQKAANAPQADVEEEE
eukprot:gene2804-12679_t